MPSANRKLAGERDRIAPHLAAYDALQPSLRPYLTIGTPPNIRSRVVSTDENGFRLSYSSATRVDSTSWHDEAPKGLLVGSSVAFGVGATSDSRTLASLLATGTGTPFLNLGVRGANSTQELISAIPFVGSADMVVVVSGVNNLTAALQSLGGNELFGPFFWEGAFDQLARWPVDALVDLIYGGEQSWGGKAARKLRLVRGAAKSVTQMTRSEIAGRSPAHQREVLVAAAERHARDLAILAAATPPATRVVFAAQPFADACERAVTTEERTLFDLADAATGARWQRVKEVLATGWDEYVERLANSCTRLDVTFVDLAAVTFDGWCFVDRVHLTDRGHDIAARAILEAL